MTTQKNALKASIFKLKNLRAWINNQMYTREWKLLGIKKKTSVYCCVNKTYVTYSEYKLNKCKSIANYIKQRQKICTRRKIKQT